MKSGEGLIEAGAAVGNKLLAFVEYYVSALQPGETAPHAAGSSLNASANQAPSIARDGAARRLDKRSAATMSFYGTAAQQPSPNDSRTMTLLRGAMHMLAFPW